MAYYKSTKLLIFNFDLPRFEFIKFGFALIVFSIPVSLPGITDFHMHTQHEKQKAIISYKF